MANYTPQDSDYQNITHEGKRHRILKAKALEDFNTDILGLGDIKLPSTPINCLAAVFDLEGFTMFCKQIEPHLAVPAYMGKFLPWLMQEIKKETIQKETGEGSELWHPLPFFVKFMGDGLLVLWGTDKVSDTKLENIVVSMENICRKYPKELVSSVSSIVVDAPPRLRCGIARGTVFSVGNQADYVGTCINMAARVQKLPGINFAFNRRGFNLEREPGNKHLKENFLIKRVTIRGVGDNELIAVSKGDFSELDAADAKFYRDIK